MQQSHGVTALKCLHFLMWLEQLITGLLRTQGKGFTPTPETTAGTHSCLDRTLMKEQHRKSSFGRPRFIQRRSRSQPCSQVMESQSSIWPEGFQSCTAQAQLKTSWTKLWSKEKAHRDTAESDGSVHMLMKVCSPKTAHMRPRQPKPQPPGPPGLCPPSFSLTPTLPDKSLTLFC